LGSRSASKGKDILFADDFPGDPDRLPLEKDGRVVDPAGLEAFRVFIFQCGGEAIRVVEIGLGIEVILVVMDGVLAGADGHGDDGEFADMILRFRRHQDLRGR
jgi:hypothetical protein